MKQTTFLTTSGLIIAGVIALGAYNVNEAQKESASPAITQQVSADERKINFSQDGKTISYNGEANETALEILKSSTKVSTSISSVGEYITSINDVKADPKKEYWAFYVNGQATNANASSYVTSSSDKIEWKLESLQ